MIELPPTVNCLTEVPSADYEALSVYVYGRHAHALPESVLIRVAMIFAESVNLGILWERERVAAHVQGCIDSNPAEHTPLIPDRNGRFAE